MDVARLGFQRGEVAVGAINRDGVDLLFRRQVCPADEDWFVFGAETHIGRLTVNVQQAKLVFQAVASDEPGRTVSPISVIYLPPCSRKQALQSCRRVGPGLVGEIVTCANDGYHASRARLPAQAILERHF